MKDTEITRPGPRLATGMHNLALAMYPTSPAPAGRAERHPMTAAGDPAARRAATVASPAGSAAAPRLDRG